MYRIFSKKISQIELAGLHDVTEEETGLFFKLRRIIYPKYDVKWCAAKT